MFRRRVYLGRHETTAAGGREEKTDDEGGSRLGWRTQSSLVIAPTDDDGVCETEVRASMDRGSDKFTCRAAVRMKMNARK